MGFSDIMSFLPGPLGSVMKLASGILPKLFGGIGDYTSVANRASDVVPNELKMMVTGEPSTGPSSYLQNAAMAAGQNSTVHSIAQRMFKQGLS